ncbi:hypothetical protein TWF696_009886 [Orbilia brochopaga]|uniref:Helicase-associated domain-containing protein n=1 Tax=Orbilia brochopaga TaxID=3140254 RepID=A0AAV9UF09_9PEZI
MTTPITTDSKIQKVVDDNRVSIWVSVLGELGRKLPGYLADAGWTRDGKSICCIHASDADAKNAVDQGYVNESLGSVPGLVGETSDNNKNALGHIQHESMQDADHHRLASNIAYSIPFEDTTSSRTRIVHMSAEVMIQGALVDPLLNRYAVVIVYGCHTCTIQIDMCLGLLKKILKKRDDLRVLVCGAMSGYLNFLSEYFSDSVIVSLDPVTYPVDVHHVSSAVSDYITTAFETSLAVIDSQTSPSNVIIFMPNKEGQELQKRLEESPQAAEGASVIVANSVSDLAHLEDSILDSDGNRSYLVITSLAPEIVASRIAAAAVIDSGFKEVRYSRYGFASMARTEPINQELAKLRALIAGLEKPGKCYRLYPQSTSLEKFETPAIQRLPLDQCILQLKSLGVDNILRFDYPFPPPAEAVAEAMDRLASMQILDNHAQLTRPLGEQLAQLPLQPLHGMLLLKSSAQGCFDQVISLIAMWLTKGEFFDHEKGLPFTVQEGDALTSINIYESFVKLKDNRSNWCRKHGLSEQRLSKAVTIREQLFRILQHRRITTSRSELATSTTIRKCISSVYGRYCAFQLSNGLYRTVHGSLTVKVHPSSVLYNRKCPWVVFEQAVEKDGQLFIKNITAVEKEWVTSDESRGKQ